MTNKQSARISIPAKTRSPVRRRSITTKPSARATTMLREVLDQTAVRIETELEDQPEVEAAVRTVLGSTYLDLGEFEAAEKQHRVAVETNRRALGDDHADTLIAIDDLAVALHELGHYDEAEAMVREALERGKRVLGSDHPDYLVWVFNMGQLLQLRDRHAEAEPYDREVVETGPKNAYAWEALTCEPADLQDPDSALVFALEAVELGQWQDPDVIDTLALAYHRTGDTVKAIEAASQALELIPEEDAARREPFEATIAEYQAALSGD